MYLHLENGGLTFEVDGSTLVITSNHYGNNRIRHEVDMTPLGLQALSEMFVKAAASGEETYSYVPARSEGETDEYIRTFKERNGLKLFYKVNEESMITCCGSAYTIEQFKLVSVDYEGEIKEHKYSDIDTELDKAVRAAPYIRMQRANKVFVGHRNGVIYSLEMARNTDTLLKKDDLIYEEYNQSKHEHMVLSL